jgi:pyridoxamine 5'-phosphate oxidase
MTLPPPGPQAAATPSYPPLTPEGLGVDPLVTFGQWLEEARDRSSVRYPNAACLSTVNGDGEPRGRIVLVNILDPATVIFFTNYGSAKGVELAQTSRAALTFFWDDLGRQVRMAGPVERASDAESDAYFATRPRGSQLGAWASRQSEPLESRSALEERVRALASEYEGVEVPRPPHWGGFRLRPDAVEFWQEGKDRLHDRILFRTGGGEQWEVVRLNP